MICFLMLVPTQLGKHFWPEWSLAGGVRVDYLAPTIYLTDLLAGLIGAVGFWKWRKEIGKNRAVICLVVGLMMINVVMAEEWRIAEVALLKWVIKIGVGVYLIREKWWYKKMPLIIFGWFLTELCLVWMQIVAGKSVGGGWYWLGERRMELESVGVARINVGDEVYLRGYGTFSHPNSLAGFVLLVWWWWREWRTNQGWWWFGTLAGLLILGLTFSRTAWLAMVIMIFWDLMRKKQSMVGLVWLVMVLVGGLLLTGRIGGWDLASGSKRIELLWVALKMVSDSPIFGVGLNNFIVKMQQYGVISKGWWQPVHNALMLFLAETGVAGLAAAGYLVSKIKWEWWVVAGLVLTGMTDHYWLTLNQNSWLIVLLVARSILKNKNEKTFG